jgi:hypothetical protein
MRKERQDLLADGGDTKKINARIEENRHRDELIEDEIVGLTQKIDRLEKEAGTLSARRIVVKETLLKEEVARPLVDRYNELATAMTEVLTDLDEALAEFDTLQIPGRPQNVLTRSSDGNPMPHVISLIGFEGELPQPHAFDRGKISAARRMKQRHEDIEGRYPRCECFKCGDYLGFVSSDAPFPSCSRIRGPIPPELLVGNTTCEAHMERLRREADKMMEGVRISYPK